MEKVRLAKTIFEKAESLDDAGPSPAAVAGGEHFDLEHIAGLRAVDPDGAGERVNAGAVDREKFGGGHAGVHLAAAGIDALDLDFVARLNAQARLERAVPDGVSGFGGERVFDHDSFTLTVI